VNKPLLIEKIFERIFLPEHDSPALKEELTVNLSRLSEKALGWLENRIELQGIRVRQAEAALDHSAVYTDRLNAERITLQTQITNALGIPLGINDCKGNPIHTGDELRFNHDEWYRGVQTLEQPEMDFEITLSGGAIHHPGATSDLTSFCTIIRKWN
jgi:hypothetical protein